MKSKGRVLPKATPEIARRVYEAQREPSSRAVARALCLGGRPIHYTTVARWKARNWVSVRSNHPLERARRRLEAAAPLVTGNPETTIDDLIDEPVRKEFDELTQGEVLRRAAREVAIATTLIAKEIQKRSTTAFNMAEITPTLVSIGNCLVALASAFDQAISLDVADQKIDRSEQRRDSRVYDASPLDF